MTIIDASADIRIEIMQALLNNSSLSKDAFDALAAMFDSIEGNDDDAWAEYKAQFGSEE